MKQDARTGYPGRDRGGGKGASIPKLPHGMTSSSAIHQFIANDSGFSRDDFIVCVTKLPSSRKYLHAFSFFWRDVNQQFFFSFSMKFCRSTYFAFSPRWFYHRLTKLYLLAILFLFFDEKIINEQFFIPPEILLPYKVRKKFLFVPKHHFKEVKSTFNFMK